MWESVAGNEAEAVRAEYGVGRTMADAVREQSVCDLDPAVRDLLRGIQTQLADRVNNPLHRFHVTSTEEAQPTAYALPGGFIFVARALVTLCEKDPDELSFVLGHEMGHVIRRHAMDRLLGQTAISAAMMASPGRGALAAWIKRVGVPWLERAYSREQEFEADEMGALLTRAAGFDPAGAVRALQRFQRLDPTHDERGLSAYFATHPPVAERIARLRERFHLAL